MLTVFGENTVKCFGGFLVKNHSLLALQILICSAEIANKITQSPCMNFESVLKGAVVSFFYPQVINNSTNLQIYKELTLGRGIVSL